MFNALLALIRLMLEIAGAVAKKLGIIIFFIGLVAALTLVSLIITLDYVVG